MFKFKQDDESKYKKIKEYYSYFFGPVINFCIKMNIHCNVFSLIVFFITGIAVFFTLNEHIQEAGAATLIIVMADIIGALVAEKTIVKKGRIQLLDSVIDRYSDVLFYSGIIVLFVQEEQFIFALFGYLSLIGSLMTIFIRLRAEQFGYNVNFGIIQRSERMIIMSLGMFFGVIGVGISSIIVALISNGTAFYLISRIWFDDSNKGSASIK